MTKKNMKSVRNMQKHKKKERERESGNHETSAIWLWSLNQVRERDESVISKWILTSKATFDEFNINTNIILWNSKLTNLDLTLSYLHKKLWAIQLNYIFQNGLLELIIPIDIYVTIKFASHTSPWNLGRWNLIK